MKKSLLESQEIDLGNVVFDPHRRDLSHKRNIEPNTDIEEEIYRVLYEYVSGGLDKKISPEMIDAIKELMSDDTYNTYFTPVKEGMELYRGLMDVPAKKIASWVGVNPEELPKDGSMKYEGVIRPRGDSNVMSFTKSLRVARDYFNLGMETVDKTYSVIFTAESSDNPMTFLDFSGGIYKTIPMDNLYYEQEVLALGPVKLSNIWWKMNE